MKDEAILYLETADGETMAVPESKIDDFLSLNEKIKAEMQLKEKAKRDTGKPNFDEAIRATEEMFAEQAQEQAIQEKETKIKKLTDDIKTLRIMNRHMQETIEKLSKENEEYLIEKNKMKTTQRRKMRILIMAYIFVIIIELFFCVPYNDIQIFLSKQGVPHTEIVGSGYATMFDIAADDARIRRSYINSSQSEPLTDYGKTINLPLLFLNISITTVLAIGLHSKFKKKEKKIVEDNIPIPMLDINGLAFADDETQKAEMAKYAEAMAAYIKSQL